MAIKSKGTKLEIGGSAGTEEPITAIAVGYPTILTSTAHEIENGDVVTLKDFIGADAGLLNGKTPVAQFVTTDTFAVPIDTIGKTITDDSGAADATPALWIVISEIVTWDGPSGSASMYDITHLASTAKEKMVGLPDEGQITLSVNWILNTDDGQKAVATARRDGNQKDFKLTFSDTSTGVFSGYVLGMSPSGGVDDKTSGSITIEITGAVTLSPIA